MDEHTYELLKQYDQDKITHLELQTALGKSAKETTEIFNSCLNRLDEDRVKLPDTIDKRTYYFVDQCYRGKITNLDLHKAVGKSWEETWEIYDSCLYRLKEDERKRDERTIDENTYQLVKKFDQGKITSAELRAALGKSDKETDEIYESCEDRLDEDQRKRKERRYYFVGFVLLWIFGIWYNYPN